MVGIVLVSHSRPLVNALAELIKQMAVDKQPSIAVAAGVGPDRGEFGTDAVEIVEAIQSVDGPDGVIVLMDLGSAILSAEMALEFLPDEVRSRVLFCAAPFVEGAVAAAVQASLGNDRETICREAEQAIQMKVQQLGQAEPPAPDSQEPPPASFAEKLLEVVLQLKNPQGLHARPATRFVQRAASFDAEIQVRNLKSGKGPVNARSLLSVISLGANTGDQIAVTAQGPEAEQALKSITQLVNEELNPG